jgi:hypothetical protein
VNKNCYFSPVQKIYSYLISVSFTTLANLSYMLSGNVPVNVDISLKRLIMLITIVLINLFSGKKT